MEIGRQLFAVSYTFLSLWPNPIRSRPPSPGAKHLRRFKVKGLGPHSEAESRELKAFVVFVLALLIPARRSACKPGSSHMHLRWG